MCDPPILPSWSYLLTLDNLGLLYRYQGRFEEAIVLFQRALHNQERQSGPEDPALLKRLDPLIQCYRAERRFEEAKRLGLRAEDIRSKR